MTWDWLCALLLLVAMFIIALETIATRTPIPN